MIAAYDAEFRAGFDRKITRMGDGFHGPRPSRRTSLFICTCRIRRCIFRPSPTLNLPAKPSAAAWRIYLTQMDAFTGMLLDKLDELGTGGKYDQSSGRPTMVSRSVA